MMTLANRLASLIILLLLSCSSTEKNLVTINGNTMGTTYTIKFFPKTNNPVEIEENYILFEKILKDITIMPLVNLWGFGPDVFESPPSETMIDSVKAFVGQDLIEVDKEKIRKKDSRVQIDLSSIAKGYAVDKIFNSLIEYEDLFIEIGGEIRTRSKNKDWIIGINTPSITNFENDIELIISLNNLSIATSGNYRNFYIIDDKFYHHEINPKTGYPISSNLGSVSIISDKSCLDADALSTMFYTIDNFDIVENLKGVESFSILLNEDKSFTKVFSSGFPKN